jgi:hypothetical protein
MQNIMKVSALPVLGLHKPNGVLAVVEMSIVKMNGLCVLRKATKVLVTMACGEKKSIDLL